MPQQFWNPQTNSWATLNEFGQFVDLPSPNQVGANNTGGTGTTTPPATGMPQGFSGGNTPGGFIGALYNFLQGPQAANIFGAYYDPATGRPRSSVEPLTPLQQGILDFVPAFAENQYGTVNLPIQNMLLDTVGNSTMRQQGAYNDAINPYNNMLMQTAQGQYLTPDSNPYLSQYVAAAQRPITDQYSKDVNAINTNAAQAGRVGSGFNAARLGEAQTARNTALGETAANIYAPAYQQERQLQQGAQQTGLGAGMNMYQYLGNQAQAAVPLLLQNMGSQWEALGKVGSAADVAQKQLQAERTAGFQDPWNYSNALWNNFINPLVGAAGMAPYNSSNTTVGGGYNPGGVSQIFGAGSSLAGLLGSLLNR